MLESLRCIDRVEIFEEDTPLNLIKSITPDILVKGGDWSADQIVGSGHVIENGGQVMSLNFVNGYSTTKIIELIKK
jgi:bifunctional ADP-heptose synthase (sugar kinase/adenylyltransferase)